MDYAEDDEHGVRGAIDSRSTTSPFKYFTFGAHNLQLI